MKELLSFLGQTLLVQPLVNGLILFYRLLGQNMGIAILAFSLFLRFLLNPLTKPYMASMKKIKEAEPQLKKLKEKYKDDKAGLMKAQADFYKEKGINPGAGCLPYLLQIVVLFALINVFTEVLAPGEPGISHLNDLLYSPLKFSDGATITTRFLYLDLAKPDKFAVPGLPFPIPGPTLILAALLQLVSSLMMFPAVKAEEKLAKKTVSKEDDFQTSSQKSMLYTFPLMTVLFGMSFPAGLALYWLIFS